MKKAIIFLLAISFMGCNHKSNLNELLSSEGGVIYVPAGTYLVHGPLRIPTGKTVNFSNNTKVYSDGEGPIFVCENNTMITGGIFEKIEPGTKVDGAIE